jgi:hypothetical protein
LRIVAAARRGSAFLSPDSPLLNSARIRDAEQYNLSQAIPGRIGSIINIHNPSTEVHVVDRSSNTGSAVILVACGGHSDAGNDAVRLFASFALTLRNGISTRLSSATAVLYDDFREEKKRPERCCGGDLCPSRLCRQYLSGPDAIRRQPDASTDSTEHRSGVHRHRRLGAIERMPSGQWITIQRCWASRVPNIEMHLYGNGRHPGHPVADGSRMIGGLTGSVSLRSRAAHLGAASVLPRNQVASK